MIKRLLLTLLLCSQQELIGMQQVAEWFSVRNIDAREAIVKHNYEELQQVLFLPKGIWDLLDEYGLHLIHYAAAAGFDEGLKEIITFYGIDVNYRDKEGKTALHHAALWKRRSTVGILLDQKAAVNAVDKQGRTAIFFATMGGDEKMIELLIGADASVAIVDKFGQSLLHVAASQGHLGVVQLLAPLLPVDQEDNKGETALMKAARQGHSGVVHALLNDYKAAVNHTNEKVGKRTALHFAAERDGAAKKVTPDTVEYEATSIVLIRAGADPSHQDNNGLTPYDLASPRLQKIFKKLMLQKQEREIVESMRQMKQLSLEA